MQTRKPLKAKKSLVGKTTLKSRRKPVRRKKTEFELLKKEAEEVFSLYILYRDGKKYSDGSWWAKCITCYKWKMFIDKDGKLDKRPIQWGHFQSTRYNTTKFHEQNVHAQCNGCNIFRNGEQYKYAQEIDLLYGDGTAHSLQKLAKVHYRFTTEALQRILIHASNQIKFYKSI